MYKNCEFGTCDFQGSSGRCYVKDLKGLTGFTGGWKQHLRATYSSVCIHSSAEKRGKQEVKHLNFDWKF
jgi:hypothetical protein